MSIRPVIVGSGLVAGSHVAALLALGARDIVVWSPNQDNRERFASTWDATAAPTLAAAISTPGATHVHVCSTPMQHLAPIEAAAAQGLAVIAEKPLAPTRELAEQALAAVENAGVAAWLGFNRRLDGGVQQLRRLIGDGAIGRPVSVSGHYRQQWNANPSGNDWRYDPAYVGPSRTVTEIGSHWFDLVAFALGVPVTHVSAQFGFLGERDYVSPQGTGKVTPPNDDLFAALLRFDGGITGTVHCTELSHGSFDEIEVRVDGTHGSAVWDSAHPNLVRVGNKTDGLRTIGVDAPSTALTSMITAICDGSATDAGVATFTDGVANAAVLDAVRDSAENSRWAEVQH